MIKYISIQGKELPIKFDMWTMTMIEEEVGIRFEDIGNAIAAGMGLKTKLMVANLGFVRGHKLEEKKYVSKDFGAMAEWMANDAEALEDIMGVYIFQVFGKRLEELIEATKDDETFKKNNELAKNAWARAKEKHDALPSPDSNK